MKEAGPIKQVEYIAAENRALRAKNIDLIFEIRRLRSGLESALNLLDPDQIRIIKSDLTDINIININQNAQSELQ